MDLEQSVDDAFRAGSRWSIASGPLVPREGQALMARTIAQKIAEVGVLVVEAGTGIGKTFAYLVPALLSGERVLISTATKTLQDQLAGRDLPQVAKSLGLPLRMAVLKGRASYLCLNRLAHARLDAHATGMRDAGEVAQIERWAADTRSGDLAELPDLHE